MTTLEDKLLGEKTHYYCSSSEDENEPDEPEDNLSGSPSERDNNSKPLTSRDPSKPAYVNDIRQWEGNSTNTGPKGVIRDWQRFKQLETEKREQQEAERLALAKRLCATVKSHREEEEEKAAKEKPDLATGNEELEEDFLKEYLEQRMKALMMGTQNKQRFGAVIEMESSDAFLENTEKSHNDVTTVVLLYEERAAGCSDMKKALEYLAAEYPEVKFCQMKASLAGLSNKFKIAGLPAIQAYRKGELIGNFVSLVKEFGDDIYPSDVESFLIEHGILQDKSLVPPILRGKAT